MVEIWLRSRHDSVPAIPPPIHDDDHVRQFFAATVMPHREPWVVEDGGAIVAMMVLEPGWIDQLYVDPEHTGRGLGSLLVDLAKSVQPGGLDLWTFQSNASARRFYERHGFVEVMRTDGDNEEGAPDVRYHWPADNQAAIVFGEFAQLAGGLA
ncbi:MAG: GNAT family N-acetyltransferase [Acidimicrobiales bacterium]